MKNKLDNILLSILWLSASALVACFWFNIKFGFNIFSAAHWRHLAYMQANQTPVNSMFYVSLIASAVIMITGLYMLIRPNFRRITLPVRDTKKTHIKQKNVSPHPQQKSQPTVTQSLPTEQNPAPRPQIPETSLARPPRLNLGTPLLNQTENFTAPVPGAIPQTAPVAPTSQQASTPQQTNRWPEIDEIFESTGYTLKKPPKIKGVQTSLFAIGTGETLWIGAVGIETLALRNAIENIQQIFSDTLEDIEINVYGFVVSPRDASEPVAPEILTFDSTDSLRNYMNEHRNTPPDNDEIENFEAFSSYISTVIEYLGKF